MAILDATAADQVLLAGGLLMVRTFDASFQPALRAFEVSPNAPYLTPFDSPLASDPTPPNLLVALPSGDSASDRLAIEDATPAQWRSGTIGPNLEFVEDAGSPLMLPGFSNRLAASDDGSYVAGFGPFGALLGRVNGSTSLIGGGAIPIPPAASGVLGRVRNDRIPVYSIGDTWGPTISCNLVDVETGAATAGEDVDAEATVIDVDISHDSGQLVALLDSNGAPRLHIRYLDDESCSSTQAFSGAVESGQQVRVYEWPPMR